ncbi:MAG: hypothetical protein MUF29_04320 [Chitinophagaceae bacterium]|nr:hypothetical protein [Chitinophagaceae bacterium]
MKTILAMALAIGCLIGTMIPAIAQPGKGQSKKSNPVGRWEKVGEQPVKRVKDWDDFNLKSYYSYNAIKLRVLHSRVHFDQMVIVFDNGKSIDIPLNREIAENGESRIIDLPTDRRKISKVRFKYSTKGLFNDRAVVQVWGRRS